MCHAVAAGIDFTEFRHGNPQFGIAESAFGNADLEFGIERNGSQRDRICLPLSCSQCQTFPELIPRHDADICQLGGDSVQSHFVPRQHFHRHGLGTLEPCVNPVSKLAVVEHLLLCLLRRAVDQWINIREPKLCFGRKHQPRCPGQIAVRVGHRIQRVSLQRPAARQSCLPEKLHKCA